MHERGAAVGQSRSGAHAAARPVPEGQGLIFGFGRKWLHFDKEQAVTAFQKLLLGFAQRQTQSRRFGQFSTSNFPAASHVGHSLQDHPKRKDGQVVTELVTKWCEAATLLRVFRLEQHAK